MKFKGKDGFPDIDLPVAKEECSLIHLVKEPNKCALTLNKESKSYIVEFENKDDAKEFVEKVGALLKEPN